MVLSTGTCNFFSDVELLQEKINTLESQSHSSTAKELQLEAALSAANSEIKQLRGTVRDAEKYSKLCAELKTSINCKSRPTQLQHLTHLFFAHACTVNI